MTGYITRIGILVVLSVFITLKSQAQIGGYAMGNAKGIYFTSKLGSSMLGTEFYSDFSGNVTEFSNRPGPSFGFEISKYITENFEAGADLSFFWLRGENDSPDFSAIGFHATMMEPITDPVEYTTRLYGPKIFTRYHLNLSNSRKAHPVSIYFKTGFGILFYESELFYKYRNDNEIIFGKGIGANKTSKVSNAVYVLGSGFTYAISNRIDLNTAINFNFVNYDFLDVVHNFDSQGNRQNILGLFSDLTIGLSVKLDKSMVPFTKNKVKSPPPEYRPFYKRYR
jgi:hypothetical protein